MRFLPLALMLACCGQPAAQTEPPLPTTFLATDRLDVADGKGLYVGRRDGSEVRVAFALPLDRVDPARRHDSERVGMSADGQTVVLIDRYATRAAGDNDSCAAGREAWLRVFSLAQATELLAVPVESCRDKIAAKEPAATWLGNDRFRIETAGSPVYELAGGGVRRL
jgi:hypothetical protein